MNAEHIVTGLARGAVPFLFVLACTMCVADAPVRAQGPAPAPRTGVSCFARAERETGLTPAQRQALCVGAPTPTGPVECFTRAMDALRITEDQAVMLCRCSPSAEPVECWTSARQESRLTDDELAQLCSPTLAQGLLGNCRAAGY